MMDHRSVPVLALVILLGACEKDDTAATSGPEDVGQALTDTLQLTVGIYHGMYHWSHWDMASGSSNGSYEIDLGVTADTTWLGRINVHDEQHVLINSDLSLSFTSGGMVTGRVVLNDSIFLTRSEFTPGSQNSYSIAAKKIQ